MGSARRASPPLHRTIYIYIILILIFQKKKVSNDNLKEKLKLSNKNRELFSDDDKYLYNAITTNLTLLNCRLTLVGRF